MIIINVLKNKDVDYYDFTIVKGDTADFQIIPEVTQTDSNETSPYQMQEGDYIEFNIRKDFVSEDPLVSIKADESQTVSITTDISDVLTVGDYFCDATLYHSGKVDTFIRLPFNSSKKQGISNFHVVHGV